MPQLINLEKYNGVPVELILVQYHHIRDKDMIFRIKSEVNAINPIYYAGDRVPELAIYSIVNEFFNSGLGGCISEIKASFKECIEEEKINVSKVEYHTELNASKMKWTNSKYVCDKRTYSYKGEQFTNEWFLWLNEKLNKLQDRRKK